MYPLKWGDTTKAGFQRGQQNEIVQNQTLKWQNDTDRKGL